MPLTHSGVRKTNDAPRTQKKLSSNALYYSGCSVQLVNIAELLETTSSTISLIDLLAVLIKWPLFFSAEISPLFSLFCNFRPLDRLVTGESPSVIIN